MLLRMIDGSDLRHRKKKAQGGVGAEIQTEQAGATVNLQFHSAVLFCTRSSHICASNELTKIDILVVVFLFWVVILLLAPLLLQFHSAISSCARSSHICASNLVVTHGFLHVMFFWRLRPHSFSFQRAASMNLCRQDVRVDGASNVLRLSPMVLSTSTDSCGHTVGCVPESPSRKVWMSVLV